MPTAFRSLKIAVCANCYFGFPTTRASNEDLFNYYNHAYTGKAKKATWSSLLNAFNPYHFDTRALAQMLLARQYTETAKTDKLLDIGPGLGYTFHTCNRLGMSMQYFAVEPQQESHPRLQKLGVTIIPRLFGATPLPSLQAHRFKVIVSSHSLEHFNAEEVPAVLKNIHALLADDGILVLEVPNEDLYRYSYFSIPHLAFFSIESLRLALEHAGFDVLFIGSAGETLESLRQQGDKTIKHIADTHEFTTDHTTKIQQSEHVEMCLRKTQRAQTRKRFVLEGLSRILPTGILQRLLNKRAQNHMPDIYTFLSHAEFQYGPDRDILRCIAKKNK
ncbi:MAG: class I SAM-dependent methyltransferase [bacterium]|nr:class I SAM-dependent methyltransferase [bacterium]